jgi:hypothetical protein
MGARTGQAEGVHRGLSDYVVSHKSSRQERGGEQVDELPGEKPGAHPTSVRGGVLAGEMKSFREPVLLKEIHEFSPCCPHGSKIALAKFRATLVDRIWVESTTSSMPESVKAAGDWFSSS